MNEKRYAKQFPNRESNGLKSDKDNLVAVLGDLRDQASKLKRTDLIFDIDARIKSLNTNNPTKATLRSAKDFIKKIKKQLESAKRLAELVNQLDGLKNIALSKCRADLVADIEQEKIALTTGDFTEEKRLVGIAFINAVNTKMKVFTTERQRY